MWGGCRGIVSGLAGGRGLGVRIGEEPLYKKLVIAAASPHCIDSVRPFVVFSVRCCLASTCRRSVRFVAVCCCHCCCFVRGRLVSVLFLSFVVHVIELSAVSAFVCYTRCHT